MSGTLPQFTQATLTGAPTAEWTSIQFGGDGRLYASQVNGTIMAFTVASTATGYKVTATETIQTINSITNYNDDGTVAPASVQGTRQVTGILLEGGDAPGVPLQLYVTSSDPRIGAGAAGADVNLDTNSGTISRLTQTSTGAWEKVDIVRGLPRSEENHAINGLQLSPDGKTLYVTVGGNTNMGAPSNNFAYLPEYAYSAAILSIDLDAVNAMPTKVDSHGNLYKYDLPVLGGNAADPNKTDPFGGFDGLNQAIITTGSPVQVYSSGYRNPYDVVVTESGKMYTIDNSANSGWGGLPIGEGAPVGGQSHVTNKPSNGGFDITDQLHLVTEDFYAGHPNPIRANPTGAGWYLDNSGNPVSLPAGWPPVAEADPRQGQLLNPNTGADGSLYGWNSSTNGLAEYTATAFGGSMQSNLVAVSWDDHLYRIQLSADGSTVTSVTRLTQGTNVMGGGLPLDVTTQGDSEPFAGTMWVANYGGPITIFTPGEGAPPIDIDYDDDGLADNVDRFAVDPDNGKSTFLAGGQTLMWNFSQNIDPPPPGETLFNMGFTGLMSNNTASFLELYDPANIKPGGAAAGFQVEQVPGGDPKGTVNTLENGFQFGLNIRPDVDEFIIETKMDNPFGGDGATLPTDYKNMGLFIGTGDQDNYLKIVAHNNGGKGGIEVAFENSAQYAFKKMYAAAITGPNIETLDSITVRLKVDPSTGKVTPSWSYTVGGTVFNGSAPAIQLSGALLAALEGTYTVHDQPSALAVGILSTSVKPGGGADPFSAFWESIKITSTKDPTQEPTAPAGDVSFLVTPNKGIGASTYTDNSFSIANAGGSTAQIAKITFDLRSAILPGMIFDPSGLGGDVTGVPTKAFTVNGKTGTFDVTASYSEGSVEYGFGVMTLTFTNFDPGDALSFSIDIDPKNIRGSDGSGAAGAVSGAELAGSHITVDYAGGETRELDIFGDGSVGGAEGKALASAVAEPILTVAGISTGQIAVNSTSQVVSITGTAGARIKIMAMTTDTADAQPTSIFDGNKAIAVKYSIVTLDANGKGTLAITVPEDNPLFLSAVVVDSAGDPIGAVSTAIVVAKQDVSVTDMDSDGLSNTVDPFALDPQNGGSTELSVVHGYGLDFSNGSTPFGAGFTGVAVNGVNSHTELATSGSVAGGKLSVVLGTGDSWGSTNTLTNAYQFGVDTDGVNSFTVETKIDNPFLTTSASGYRSVGMQIGDGTQGDYAKIVFNANGGQGGVQFGIESDGTTYNKVKALGVALPDVAYAKLFMDVAVTGTQATVTARWTLHDASGGQIGAGSHTSKALSGDLLAAVLGDYSVNGVHSDLAVGITGTAAGSASPFTAQWDYLHVTDGTQQASIVVDGTDALTGSLGHQQWGEIGVTATSWSGGAALAVQTTGGLGVKGGRPYDQVDYNPATGLSEALNLDFGASVNSATLRIGKLSKSEVDGKIEVGFWKAFDAAGTEVGQGVINPFHGTQAGSSIYDFNIDPVADFTRLELTALPYANGPAAGSTDSSDFSVVRVAYDIDSII
jgi:hypothetical protein